MSNYHVLIVHFPIALLVLYSLLEIVRFRRLQDLPYYFHVKAFLLIVGTGSAVLAGLTGALIKSEFRASREIRQVLEIHSSVAQITTVYFGIYALLYFIAWLGRENLLSRMPSANKFLPHVEKCLRSRWMIAVGLIGLLLITLTGALGGIIAYGPSVDPITQFVYSLFGFGK